jgi:hypothetical protein
VDHLVAGGWRCITVVDIAASALDRTRSRLPTADVNFVEADVVGPWTPPPVDIWHDRAFFHFLTSPADRVTYVARLRAALNPGGSAIIATFAPGGPQQCSGLPVLRYGPDAIAAELGSGFLLAETVSEDHRTPSGSVQRFCYTRFVRRDAENP